MQKESRYLRVLRLGTFIPLTLGVLLGHAQFTFAQQWNTNTNDISNANTGNVGVGTTTPSHKLDVQGSVNLGFVVSNDIRFKGTYSGSFENLIRNGGLESWTVGTLSPPDEWVNPGFVTFARDSTIVKEGLYSLKLTWLSTGPQVQQFADLTNHPEWKGKTFTARAWVYDTSGVAGNTKLRVYDGVASCVNDHSATSGWQLLQVTCPISASANQLRTSIQINSGVIYIDGVQLRQGTFDSSFSSRPILDSSISPQNIYSPLNILGGNLGIGTVSPSYKLDVQGGSINASGGLCIAGDCKTSWSQVGGGGGVSSAANVSAGQFAANTGGGDFSFPGHITQDNSKLLYAKNSAGTVEGWMWPRWSDNIMYTNFGSAGWNIRNNTSANVMFFTNGGNVGIGVTAPNESLSVFRTAAGWQGRFANSSGSGADVYLSHGSGYGMHIRGWNSADNIYTLELYNNTAQTNVFYNSGRVALGLAGNVGIGTTNPTKKLDVVGDVNASGTITAGTITAKYQDVAEWVESSQRLPAGTIVVLDHTKSNQVVASTRAYDTRVAGVISAQPGIVLGESGEAKVLVATTGRVKIKVDATRAPIQVGDLLVTGNREGFAMKSLPLNIGGVQLHRPGTLVGKALEPLAKGTGEILVLLSLQ